MLKALNHQVKVLKVLNHEVKVLKFKIKVLHSELAQISFRGMTIGLKSPRKGETEVHFRPLFAYPIPSPGVGGSLRDLVI